jgi:hypothetical protein
MSERTVADIREEIAAERRRLDDNLTALEAELLSGAPLVVGGLVAAVALMLARGRRRKRKKPTAITLSWRR